MKPLKGGRLEPYRQKRDFEVTPEPTESRTTAEGNSFVIQNHAATRLHWDFRLEMGGVHRSWAVTKVPTLDPSVKRLAVHTEDHPISYGDFEGTIPAGQYGAGTVIIWDRGTWAPMGDVEAGYHKGSLKFRLVGKKLKGGFALVRLRDKLPKDGGKNWLLIKEKDEYAQPGSGDALAAQNKSVVSGQFEGRALYAAKNMATQLASGGHYGDLLPGQLLFLFDLGRHPAPLFRA